MLAGCPDYKGDVRCPYRGVPLYIAIASYSQKGKDLEEPGVQRGYFTLSSLYAVVHMANVAAKSSFVLLSTDIYNLCGRIWLSWQQLS
jgi:hypothetical protein